LLGEQDGVALRQHEHAEAEPDPAGHRCQVADGYHDLQPRLLTVEVRGQRDVIAHPQRLEPGLLGEARPVYQGLRAGAGAVQQPIQAVLHHVPQARSARAI
jgi:hypothetical protein